MTVEDRGMGEKLQNLSILDGIMWRYLAKSEIIWNEEVEK